MKKVFCIHPNIQDINSFADYLGIIDTDLIKSLEWDADNPTYLFVSEHIYLNLRMFKKFKKFINNEDIIKIYLAGECIAPDMNLFDYAIVFDRELKDMDRIVRFPPTILHKKSIFQASNELDVSTAKNLLKNKNRFCCFIYSNKNAHPMRDKLFYEISKYKQVDSLGKHLHNVTIKSSRTDNNWRKLSVEMKSQYKFSIASENASYEGYTSEKLFSSFQAHTVPIYWGNPYVANEFNEKAFVNCAKFDNFDDLISLIKKIDENDDIWCEMVTQPWQTEEQVITSKKEVEKYYLFINRIFEQDIKNAHRIPLGTYPSRYREFFARNRMMLLIKYSKVGKAWDKLLSLIINKQ